MLRKLYFLFFALTVLSTRNLQLSLYMDCNINERIATIFLVRVNVQIFFSFKVWFQEFDLKHRRTLLEYKLNEEVINTR